MFYIFVCLFVCLSVCLSVKVLKTVPQMCFRRLNVFFLVRAKSFVLEHERASPRTDISRRSRTGWGVDTAELYEIRAGFHITSLYSREIYFCNIITIVQVILTGRSDPWSTRAGVRSRLFFSLAASSGLSVRMCVCDRPRLVFPMGNAILYGRYGNREIRRRS